MQGLGGERLNKQSSEETKLKLLAILIFVTVVVELFQEVIHLVRFPPPHPTQSRFKETSTANHRISQIIQST